MNDKITPKKLSPESLAQNALQKVFQEESKKVDQELQNQAKKVLVAKKAYLNEVEEFKRIAKELHNTKSKIGAEVSEDGNTIDSFSTDSED